MYNFIFCRSFEIQYAELMDTDESEEVTKQFSNKTYYLQADNVLQPQDLLSYARQIAIGMVILMKLLN